MSSAPYTVNIGFAISRYYDTSVEKPAVSPMLGPTLKRTYLVNRPTVKIIDGVWNRWYTSGMKWQPNYCMPESVFQFVHATSHDGFEWVATVS